MLLEFGGSVAPGVPPGRKIFVPKIGLYGAHGDEKYHDVLVPFVADSKVLEAEGGVGNLGFQFQFLCWAGAYRMVGKESTSILRGCRGFRHCCRMEEQWSLTNRRNR